MPARPNDSNTAPPLVRIDRINGTVFAVFTDPNRPGFEYDPSVHSAVHAAELVHHMREKRWVTPAHLAQFVRLMTAEFGEAVTA